MTNDKCSNCYQGELVTRPPKVYVLKAWRTLLSGSKVVGSESGREVTLERKTFKLGPEEGGGGLPGGRGARRRKRIPDMGY